MKDPRIDLLARNLVRHSVKAQAKDKILIQANNCVPELVRALVRECYAVNALPFVSLKDKTIERQLLLGATEEQLRIRADIELNEMSKMDCFIGFTAPYNLSAWSDVPQDKIDMYNRIYYHPVHLQERLNHTRWVVLRSPTASMAQLAGMSEEGFEDFFYDVCTLDYDKMSKAMDSLVEIMKQTDKVRITAPNTDLTFSIKGLPPVKCDGGRNIPDGEVYTAPVKNSVNGIITYNTPSLESGFVYENIQFVFENGKIVKAIANDSERINKLLDTDEGARYIGEFSLGVNPYILHPMKETLFDEKISGSIHFTPGNAYESCDNGNRSAIHWDLVLIQRKEYGGGNIYFDDILIRKDGIFVLPELECLNPEHLK